MTSRKWAIGLESERVALSYGGGNVSQGILLMQREIVALRDRAKQVKGKGGN